MPHRLCLKRHERLLTRRRGDFQSEVWYPNSSANEIPPDVQITGFFQGATVPVIGGALETGVNYFVYAGVSRSLRLQNNEPSIVDTLVASASAGAALSFILGPVELVKCRLQLQHAYYRSPLTCLRLTVQDEGLRGLCRGLGATLVREVPGNAIFFTTYEVRHHPSVIRTLHNEYLFPLYLVFWCTSCSALHNADQWSFLQNHIKRASRLCPFNAHSSMPPYTETNPLLNTSASVFKIKLNVFWILWPRKYLFG